MGDLIRLADLSFKILSTIDNSGLVDRSPSVRRYSQVIGILRDIPLKLFLASGLGTWSRKVLALAEEPGATACKAYLEAVRCMLASAESTRQQQSRVMKEASAAPSADANGTNAVVSDPAHTQAAP